MIYLPSLPSLRLHLGQVRDRRAGEIRVGLLPTQGYRRSQRGAEV